jgi:hypothetical protein
MKFPRSLIGALALLWSSLACAQGTLPALPHSQQFSFTNCVSNTNACGTPLSGGLLYFYQVGTNNVVQNSFQDTALSLTNPWPLVLDANGRVPSFYLASGSVHVRLTDANGVVQFDDPTQLVIGPVGGGGGGGSGVDPTTVAATGDIKFRFTSEFVTGWVRLNAQTIGNAGSGASQRANADTSALFTYVYNNCPDAHCPVVGGRGATAAADFAALKQITLPDWRGRGPVGLDDMGNTAAGRLQTLNVTSGGGDTVTTPGATGGEAVHTITQAQIPSYALPVTDPGHPHTITGLGTNNVFQNGGATAAFIASGTTTTNISTTGIAVNSGGSGTGMNVMSPFMLGSWYLKL